MRWIVTASQQSSCNQRRKYLEFIPADRVLLLRRSMQKELYMAGCSWTSDVRGRLAPQKLRINLEWNLFIIQSLAVHILTTLA